MKSRRTNFEAVPEHGKADTDRSDFRDPMGTQVNQPTKPEARLGREVQARIGQQLRALYDNVVNEGVPQHINDLIRRLSDQD